MSDTFEDFLRLSAIDLDEGDTVHVTCPQCLRTNKLYITRIPTGLLYNCFYATCPIKGYVPSKGFPSTVKARNAYISKLAREPVCKVSDDIPVPVRRLLREKYCITPYHIERNMLGWQDNQLTYYVFNLSGTIVGSGKKTLKEFKGRPELVSKPHHYLDTSSRACGVYFPRTCRIKANHRTVAVVEGWLDAIRVGDYMPCGALLGVSLSEKGAVMLARHFDNLFIMLDPDTISVMNAYPQAKIMKKYGALFDKVQVIVLKNKDPKDLNRRELSEVLGV